MDRARSLTPAAGAAPAADALARAVSGFVAEYLDGARTVCVGLSGGPDSLALTAAALRAGYTVRALIVDHRLQRGSAQVADAAAVAATALGADAEVIAVSVGHDGGMEAAARAARYAALDTARGDLPVLLAHTADDQAETVLLGLARGSGARSIAGMRPWAAPWGRPLLGLRRADTVAACTELGLAPHADPHNRDPRFTRVRLRSEVMPLLEEVLHGGVVEALGRTATALQADTDALDTLAAHAFRRAYPPAAESAGAAELDTIAGLNAEGLLDEPAAIRTRVVRLWLLEVGATEPTARLIGAVDALLIGASRGQVAIGGDSTHRLVVERVGAPPALRTARLPR